VKQEKNDYLPQLIVTSVMMIICGLWHMLWRILSAFTSIADKVQGFSSESFIYNELSSYIEILGGGSSMATVHSLLLKIVVPLQIACGIAGIIIAAVSKMNINIIRIIPFLLGLAMCLIGASAALTAVVSGVVPVYICVFLTFTLFVVPLLYEVFAVKALIGGTK